MRHYLITKLGALGLMLAGAAPALATGTLPPGWTEYAPGGETLCARGAPFSFFVHEGASDKVIVDFIGGGACWDADTCDNGSIAFTDSVDEVRDMATSGNLHGVYDAAHADNPYKGWTHVVIPYCTGDVHWGSADATYKRANGTSFVIHHRGAINAQAVLDWVHQHYTAPAKMLVTGCSAGSYGSIFWTPKVRETFPNADLRQFGDSGAGIMTPSFLAASVPLWNIALAAPAWVPGLNPAETDYTHLQLADFYTKQAAYYPNVHFAQFNRSQDMVQTFFYEIMGGDQTTWSPQMFQSIATIESKATNFSAFTAAGDQHCATIADDFYTVQSSGVSLRDWVDGYVNGNPAAPNVTCDQCGSK